MLTLATVVEPAGPSVEECLAYLAKIAERIEADGAGKVERVVRDGSVVPGLLEVERASEGELTVMATHGRGGLSRMWLGSVASGFLHQTQRPLILVRPEDGGAQPVVHWGFAKLLVPLDGSGLAEEVLRHAIAFGSTFDASYHASGSRYPGGGGSEWLRLDRDGHARSGGIESGVPPPTRSCGAPTYRSSFIVRRWSPRPRTSG